MALAKYLKRAALVIGTLVALIAAALVIVLAVGISVNVDGIRARVETAASSAIVLVDMKLLLVRILRSEFRKQLLLNMTFCQARGASVYF